MRLHLRADSVGGDHTHMSLFVNGALAGTLTMRNAEAIWFHHILWKGSEYLRLKPSEFAFNASGRFPEPPGREMDFAAVEQRTP